MIRPFFNGYDRRLLLKDLFENGVHVEI